jgi:hypothetical protein
MTGYTNGQSVASNGESTTTQAHVLLHQIADFTALYETLEDKIISRENALEEKLATNETLLAEQLHHISAAFAEFQTIMTEAGAARWRIAAENAQREGKAHLQTLQQVSTNLVQTVKEGCEQLSQTTSQTIAGIAQATQTLPIKDFTQTIEQGCEQLKTTATSSIEKLAGLIRWFHWRNMAMALAVTLFVIFLAGLYENDEWPWQTHAQVVKERSAGQALVAAWPHLTPAEQQDIINASKKNLGL